MADKKLVSFKLEDFVSTGLINDVDVETISTRTCMFEYPGTSISALAVEMTVKNLETDDQSLIHLTAGKGFVPDSDGVGFVPAGSKTALEKSSNFYKWLESAIAAGFPKDKVGNDVTVFNGLKWHIKRVPSVGREGTSAAEKEIIILETLISLPGEKTKGAKAAKASAGASAKSDAPASSAKSESAGDPESLAKTVLKNIVLAAENKTLPLDKIRNAGFKALKDNAGARNAVLDLITNKDWLEANADALELMFDGNEIAG